MSNNNHTVLINVKKITKISISSFNLFSQIPPMHIDSDSKQFLHTALLNLLLVWLGKWPPFRDWTWLMWVEYKKALWSQIMNSVSISRQVIFHIGYFYILPICIVTAQLKNQCLHMWRDLLLWNFFNNFRHSEIFKIK